MTGGVHEEVAVTHDGVRAEVQEEGVGAGASLGGWWGAATADSRGGSIYYN